MPESRYSRQEILPFIKKAGQQKIERATVAIVGLGAIGSTACELLVRAGCQNLIIIDRDLVEESNLQRQLLYSQKDLGKSKALAAKKRLLEINHHVKITEYPLNLSGRNVSLLGQANLILDCTDNLKTRFLINDFCKKGKKVWIYASAIQSEGYVLLIKESDACLRCFLTDVSLPTCETQGVLSTLTTTIAALQITTAIKYLINPTTPQHLYYINIWTPSIKQLSIKKKIDCPTCKGKYEYLEQPEEPFVHFCSTGKYQLQGHPKNFKILKTQLSKLGKVTVERNVLYFQNFTIFKDGRALISAKSAQEAQSLYSKYIGN